MDNRKIRDFIHKADRRLKLLYLVKMLQISLCFGLAAALLLLGISRLFIFPYYGFYAYLVSAGTIFAIWLWSIRKLPRKEQSIAELDAYTPHNQLLTLSQLPAENELAADLAAKTEKEIHLSYQLFSKDRNDWFSPKLLMVSLGLIILLILSSLLPAATQLEAKEQEQEDRLIEEIVEKVGKQKQLAKTPLVRKELESLEEKLAESDTPEQALRELVKKQKELELQKQKKLQEDSELANKEAQDLAESSSQLAEQAGNTQTALSEMGKPVAFDLQQSIAANELSEQQNESGADGTETGAETGESSGSPSGEENQGGEEAGSEDSESSEEAGTGGEGTSQTGGEGEAAGEGEGQGAGEGSSESEETSGESGSSSGQGTGQSSGTGQGAGTGQGSRELLSIPSRIGGSGETTLDNGELSEGENGSFEEGPVNAERGTVRPYREVVGSYSDSYFSSAERMKLPPDLQSIVEQYFSSIESE